MEIEYKNFLPHAYQLAWLKVNVGEIFERNTWMGVPVASMPLDLWTYQKVIWELKPPFVIQTGIWAGGCLLFLADVLKLTSGPRSRVLGIDVNVGLVVAHFGIQCDLIEGDSISSEVIEKVTSWADGGRGLVSLDSLHTPEHVAQELELYQGFADYIVVEDYTNTPGLPQVVEEFMEEHPFVLGEPWGNNMCSWHGWLRRIDGS